MDIRQKLTSVLLILTQVTCFAVSNTQFWIGTGYDISSQSFLIDTKIIPPALGIYIPPVDRIPLTIDESGIFMDIEMEKKFSLETSGSLKLIFFNPEKSAIHPFIIHNNVSLLEAYGKYHLNLLTYVIGYSLQHDSIKISSLSANYSDEISRVLSSLAIGTELKITPFSRLSFTTMMSIPFFDDSIDMPVLPYSKYNIRIAASYNLDSL